MLSVKLESQNRRRCWIDDSCNHHERTFCLDSGKAQPPLPPRVNENAKRQLVGATSCSASVCHGGADLGQAHSEATTWRALDPHARVFDALLSRSRKPSPSISGAMAPRPTSAALSQVSRSSRVRSRVAQLSPKRWRRLRELSWSAQEWSSPHYRPAWQQADKQAHRHDGHEEPAGPRMFA